ncbi:MAG TPA: hypothetical protein VGJ94_15555 [Syntrophorhabdaceae bacterium]|jgi:hypothetical protein
MGDYDDERPDWREIDRKRDRSGGGGGSKEPKKERLTDRWKAGRVKEALDRIFMGEKGTPEHDKAYRKLHNAYGSERFGKTVNAYIEKYGPPDDVPTLILVLDAKDSEIMEKVFERFKSVYGGLSGRHKEDILRKLSIMALSDKSKEVRMKAGELMEELKGAP